MGTRRLRGGGIVLAALLLVAAMTMAAVPARGSSGGPVVLMGIDAEDGGPGAHGPITVYESVVSDILSNVTNGGSGIVVFGSGRNAFDGPTTFWTAIGTDLGIPVTQVNGAANVTAQSLAGFAMIAVASDEANTPGGLTEDENNALAARAAEIAAFVNGGGGLLGFSQSPFFTQPYGYLGAVGAFTTTGGLSYADITPTADGLAIGVTDALDVCCWHDEYLAFPAFLSVLATNTATGNAAALGGAQVIIGPVVPEIDIKPGSDPNSINLRNKNGVIPVGLLGSDTFDVTTVDVSTLVFEGAVPDHDLTDPAVYADHLQDVNGDGVMDLVSHYRAQQTALTGASTEGCLDFTADGVDYTACDAVRIVKS